MTATNVRNTITATIATGLVLFGITAVEATLNPARAATGDPFRAAVERSIDDNLQLPIADRQGVATVAVRIGRDGAVRSVGLVASTGSEALDREALRTAKSVSYPGGSERDVVMVLGFGRSVTVADRAKSVALAAQYRTDHRQLLASGTSAQPDG